MNTSEDTFKRKTEQYMNANGLALVSLKGALERNTDKPWPAEFKAGLRQAIDERTLSIAEFEQLTDAEFDEEDELIDWLTLVWEYLYEDGPEPE